ncbi:MAG: ribonuclease H-like domain-containing protein [Pirellulales bacterium]
MLSDEVRARLAQLHAVGQATHGEQRAPVMATGQWPPLAGMAPRVSDKALDDDLLDDGIECHNPSGSHLRFRRPLTDYWPAVESALVGVNRSPVAHSHPELAALAGAFPRDTLFLDLETCGFAGSMVFLAGVVWHDETLMVDQLFARNYAEERALLETLWQIAGRNRVLVTFNGKSFDWPMVHDRSTRHHLGRDARKPGQPPPHVDLQPREALARYDSRPELVHCDLLHHARRRWKRLLPNCRLQTLEWYVCRRARHDDLPGAMVPAAYHEFVRTGVTHQLGSILRHNALDLVTLAHLACQLLVDAEAAPVARRA